jgi:hypothetical protein
MAKHLIIFVILLTILMLFICCKPEPIKPQQVQPPQTKLLKPEQEHLEIEPPRPEPNVPVPLQAKPAKEEPNEVPAPPEVEPNKVVPLTAEPNNVIPEKAEPPKIEPESSSQKVEPNEVGTVDKVSFHNKCAGILNEFVNDKGMVNYDVLRRNKPELSKLLDEFAKLDPKEYKSWSKEDKIAFWINAYNIKMLKVIVDNYPIESTRMLRIVWGPYSIRHIDKNIGGIWRSKFIVMGEEFTLSEIDRRFFREEFDEPRVFLAITHASISSPYLRNEPYCGQKLNEQLDEQCKKFLSSPRAFKIDRENNIVYLSAILKPSWYGQYFLKKYGTDKKFKDQEPDVRSVLNFVINYTPENDASYLELKNYTVTYLSYDWTINDGS